MPPALLCREKETVGECGRLGRVKEGRTPELAGCCDQEPAAHIASKETTSAAL